MRPHGLLAMVAAVCLSTAASAQTAQVGVFMGGWLSSAMPENLSAYERALGRPVTLIVQFNGENYAWTGPNSIASSAGWLVSQPNRTVAQGRRRLVYALHLGILKPWPPVAGLTQQAFDATNFAEIAAGKHDDAYSSVGRNLVTRGFANAYIRLGQEGNGAWFPGCICSDKVGFIAAFNHVAALLKTISPDFVITLDFAADRSILAATDPIDWSLVGAINLDIYDTKWFGATPELRWSYLLGHGINDWLALGKTTGKPLAIFEWGVGAMGDNPYAVAKIAALIANPANNIIAMAYWQSSAAYPGVLSPTVNPLAWAEYVKDFGRPP